MEKEVVELQESTNLFDVTIPDYRDIKLCRREIVVLKELWDIVIFVQVSSPMYFGCLNITIVEEMRISPLITPPQYSNNSITQ